MGGRVVPYGEIFIDVELDFLARQGPDSVVGRSNKSAIVRSRRGRGAGMDEGVLDLHFDSGFGGGP